VYEYTENVECLEEIPLKNEIDEKILDIEEYPYEYDFLEEDMYMDTVSRKFYKKYFLNKNLVEKRKYMRSKCY